jgi:serine/threonine protein kinase
MNDELSNIKLQELVMEDSNYIGSGAFGDVYYVRDVEGNENQKYVVKKLRKHFLDKMEVMVLNFLKKNKIAVKEDSKTSLDKVFLKEVKALYELKGQGIGPELVYVNFDNHYYVVERMHTTFHSLIVENLLKPSQAFKLLALSDRYIESPYYHQDLHTNNVMWSSDLNDFRMIDWGISLLINPEIQGELEQEKVDNLFKKDLMWHIMNYTQYKINTEVVEEEKTKWEVIGEKISDYIKRKYPTRVNEYDIFSQDFKYKTSLSKVQKKIENMQNPPTAPVGTMNKIKRELEAAGFKGGRKTRRKSKKGKKRKTRNKRKRKLFSKNGINKIPLGSESHRLNLVIHEDELTEKQKRTMYKQLINSVKN